MQRLAEWDGRYWEVHNIIWEEERCEGKEEEKGDKVQEIEKEEGQEDENDDKDNIKQRRKIKNGTENNGNAKGSMRRKI